MTEVDIRQSTDGDLNHIHTWLQEQSVAETEGSFLCNWNLTAKAHAEGRLLVATHGSSQIPIAYQWGGLEHPGILEVREDMRGKGIGKAIVAHCIDKAKTTGVSVLTIECTPESSRPFWEKMGFTVYDEEYRQAYKILDLDHPLDSPLLPKDVSISFFPESRKWDSTAQPLNVFSPAASENIDGNIQLASRVSVFTELSHWNGDPVVEICVDGKQLYLDKAKYPEAELLGVERTSNAIFIDRLTPTPN